MPDICICFILSISYDINMKILVEKILDKKTNQKAAKF